MEETIKIRKDKVKNVAIVFLSVMLVLTFFSNSILNRALPEVATAYVQYNTITEKVRGNGTVTADDPYKVVVKDTRTIESVAVKVGDEVLKDQVLFYLEDAESEELTAKEKEVEEKEKALDDLILNYTTNILSGDISNEAFSNIRNNNIASVTAYQAKIEAAKQKVKSAEDTLLSLERQRAAASGGSSENIDIETEKAVAQINKSNAETKMSEAQANVTAIQQKMDSLEAEMIAVLGLTAGTEVGIDDINTKLVELQNTIDGNEDTTGSVKAYQKTKDALTADNGTGALKTSIPAADGTEEIPAMTDEEIATYFTSEGFPIIDKGPQLLEEAKKRAGDNGKTQYETMMTAYMQYLDTRDKRDAVKAIYDDYFSLPGQLSSAQTALNNATNEYNAYANKIDSLSKESAENSQDHQEWLKSLETQIKDAENAKNAAEEEKSQLLLDISKELDLSNQNSIIADTREELSELKAELEELKISLTDATVVAPVDGTIISIDKTAGESTVPQEAIATIQVAGKGMSLSFAVTNAQAAKVKVGDKAQLQNAWYYNDVMITLSKIKPDPEDPGKKKLLEFTVEGPVQSGESLAVSVGERSAEYEHVVPNSAIREDNKGKFILIIDEKTTPFGNRYKARRVDVEVLASDEINTAVTADLQGYEYVITTSNQPVKAGDQVRLNG